MIVRSLRLLNFRNYTAQEIELPTGLIALTGDNGQGKTNLLEALCVLATTKSPLVERDRELIRWNESEARIAAEIELSARVPSGRHGERRTLEYGWRIPSNGAGALARGTSLVREMRAGGVPQSALGQWLGQLQVVAFFPHDLTIITGEPGERRRFLNLELGKSRPAHFADAARYRRALQQRNALLRHLMESRARGRGPLGPAIEGLGTLAEWNRQLITYGARILAQRAQFLRELAPIVAEVHRNLSGHDEILTVQYAAGVAAGKAGYNGDRPSNEESGERWSGLFMASLETDHEGDMRRGTTQSGPHRDDLIFKLGDMDLRRYGSQGQQRLAVLALKVALARWVADVTGEPPVLLLDDALSELDATRRGHLLQEAARFPQSVLTATDLKLLESSSPTLLSVEAGRITPLSTPSSEPDPALAPTAIS
jgi:DNA replication and repair protein RecF